MAAMQPTVAAGLSSEGTFTITTGMTTAHTGTAVFSTPSMIQLMDDVSAGAVQPHLDANESSVGTHVCVSHVAGAAVGEVVPVRSELQTVERDRFLTFAVSAHIGDRLLGEG